VPEYRLAAVRGRRQADVVPDTRVLTPDDWQSWRELRLIALEESPDAFGSRLADWQGDGDREERWRDRLTSVALNVMVFDGDLPVGMASGARDGDDVELISMYVRPIARGLGVADLLVDAVAAWTADSGATHVVLAVRESNERATALYRRHGFEVAGPAPGEPGEPPEVTMRRPAVRGD
jgi:ribosomal protein S18 acetylase RimI-like enzyme